MTRLASFSSAGTFLHPGGGEGGFPVRALCPTVDWGAPTTGSSPVRVRPPVRASCTAGWGSQAGGAAAPPPWRAAGTPSASTRWRRPPRPAPAAW
uniref:Uncharacterized protein n=1 Tax=Ixodes ricinus TaxID=34613 RepID=A0A6B0UE99_IXORI